MPLSSKDFPADVVELARLVVNGRKLWWRSGLSNGQIDRAADVLGRSLELFWNDFIFQICPPPFSDVREYCRAVARLINEDLYEYVEDDPPAMWELAQVLLKKAGLSHFNTATRDQFYQYAGVGKPAHDLANHVFIGHWH